MSSKKASGSTMASTSMVPARTAHRRHHDGGGRAGGKGSSFPLSVLLEFLQAELETPPQVAEKGDSVGLGGSS